MATAGRHIRLPLDAEQAHEFAFKMQQRPPAPAGCRVEENRGAPFQ